MRQRNESGRLSAVRRFSPEGRRAVRFDDSDRANAMRSQTDCSANANLTSGGRFANGSKIPLRARWKFSAGPMFHSELLWFPRRAFLGTNPNLLLGRARPR